MKIEVICEGNTEETVCLKIVEILKIAEKSEITNAGSKDKLNPLIRAKLRNSKIIENGFPSQSVNFLVLRDLDTHDKETEVTIQQSLTSVLENFFSERQIPANNVNLSQNSSYPNLYTLAIPNLNFRLALHIATKRWSEYFIKSTIDDYVLELALRINTVNRLATRISIPPDRIVAKITQEIPDLLKANANGKDDLTEAKDYVRLYAAVLKLHTSPAVFAKIVMANADVKDIREVFGALIAAFEFVGDV